MLALPYISKTKFMAATVVGCLVGSGVGWLVAVGLEVFVGELVLVGWLVGWLVAGGGVGVAWGSVSGWNQFWLTAITRVDAMIMVSRAPAIIVLFKVNHGVTFF
jgi:hypothetical protein